MESNQDDARSMIVDFVVRQRQSGACLSYQEYQIIEEWIQLARGDMDRLVLILGEEIPKLYSDNVQSRFPRRLSAIRKKVAKRLPGFSLTSS